MLLIYKLKEMMIPWLTASTSLVFGRVLLGLILLAALKFLWEWKRARTSLRSFPGLKPFFLLGNMPWQVLLLNRYSQQSPTTLLHTFCLGSSKLFRKEKISHFWIGTKPYVLLYDSGTVEALLSSTSELDKSFEYKFLHDWLGTGLLTSTGRKWRSRRKMLTPTFHFRILDNFQEVFNEQSLVFIRKVKQLSADGKPLDVMPIITRLTMDIICDTAMGIKLGAQESKNSDYVDAVNVAGKIILERVLRPIFWPRFIFRLSPSGRTFYKQMEILHSFTDRVIKERRSENQNIADNSGDENEPKRRLVFLDILLQEQKITEGFTDRDIREEVDTFMFEGHDTTSVAICWAFFLLGHHPEIQKKVQEELDTIFNGDLDAPITSKEVKEMKYLECVLKECLRLYPSVPLIGRHLKEDLKVGKYIIPANTTCFVFPPGLHQDPEVFPDPDFFNPDRFLPENCSGRHPYAYVPFSAGSRNCIGQKFALNEEKTVVAQCLRHFNLQSINHRDEIPVLPELVTRPSKPVFIRFIERQDVLHKS